MYDRILLAVDGSEEARRAAERGLELARTVEAAVDVVHVVEGAALELTRTGDERRRLRNRGETALEEIEDLAVEFDRPVTTELAEGKPAAEISEHAAETDADLVVVGRQGMTGIGRRILGGVTERVLSRSDVPVFVVPDDGGDHTSPAAGYSRLLVPTDGSENAQAAAPHGAAIARHCDADVHVLNVVDLQAAGGAFDAGGLTEEFIERLEARGREATDRVVDEIEETADLNVQAAVERTKADAGVATGIREYVDENRIDLVVMGSHGRSNVGRQLFGSVASGVLRTVDVPVVVVKRPSGTVP